MKPMNTKAQTRKIGDIILVLAVVFLVIVLARKYFDIGDQMGDEATGIVDDVKDSGLDVLTSKNKEEEDGDMCPDKDKGYYSVDGDALSLVFDDSENIERIHENDLEIIEKYLSEEKDGLDFENEMLNENLKQSANGEIPSINSFCQKTSSCDLEKFKEQADVELICKT
ncbi:MAG: hypothetical protein ACOCU6_00160 [Nanoarchaeota archaeon]